MLFIKVPESDGKTPENAEFGAFKPFQKEQKSRLFRRYSGCERAIRQRRKALLPRQALPAWKINLSKIRAERAE